MLYTKVVDATGKTILDNNNSDSTEVFSPETAYIMYDMLKGPVTYYSGTPAKWGEMPVSGKTGTTSDSCDLWFAGLTPYLSGSVWLGYDNPTKLVGGSSACAKLWGMLMERAHEGLKVKEIEEPSGIVKVAVCKDSGLLPSSLCSQDPRGNRVYEELFAEGTEPTTACDVHVIANINRLNNKLATPGTPSFLTRKSIFIKKSNPNPATADYYMVLPSRYDTTTSYNNNEVSNEEQPENSNNTNSNENNAVNSNNTQTGPVTDPTVTPTPSLSPPTNDGNTIPIITPIN